MCSLASKSQLLWLRRDFVFLSLVSNHWLTFTLKESPWPLIQTHSQRMQQKNELFTSHHQASIKPILKTSRTQRKYANQASAGFECFNMLAALWVPTVLFHPREELFSKVLHYSLWVDAARRGICTLPSRLLQKKFKCKNPTATDLLLQCKLGYGVCRGTMLQRCLSYRSR